MYILYQINFAIMFGLDLINPIMDDDGKYTNFGRLTFGMGCMFIIIVVIPPIIWGIASFTIASIYQNLDCDGSAISLSTWLYVNSAVTLAVVIFLMLSSYSVRKYRTFGYILFLGTIICSHLFLIVWNIVGAIVLFRDSDDCQEEAESIWILVLILLIGQWCAFCSIGCQWCKKHC